jgi:hypothetical protein
MVRYLEELEPRRGCGYRRIGKLYLIGEGIPVGCHRLPLLLEVCPTCGQGIKFSRGWTWIKPMELFGKCSQPPVPDYEDRRDADVNLPQCHPNCPVCFPPDEATGLMWVGEKFYSPESFILEARQLGVSKVIPSIPKGFQVGKTWIYLAHKKAGEKMVEDPGTLSGYRFDKAPAVFYAFRPTRIEMLVKLSDATEEKIKELEERGITPVIVPDEYEEMVQKAE